MKRLFISALSVLSSVGLFAQQVPGIFNSDANVTITQDEIIQNGRQYDHSSRNGAIVLDFEGLGNNDQIMGFYDGGTSHQGFSGPNYGIYFDPRAVSLIDSDAGGSGNFANEPSPNTVMFFSISSIVSFNVYSGFTSGFSFYYTANQIHGRVDVWSEINGTGYWLASYNLPVNSNLNCTGDPTGDFCHWDLFHVSFSGTAKSVIFTALENHFGIDDITIGSPGGANKVPLSNRAIFLAFGLIIVVAIYRFTRIIRG